ncbi:hypothetical protein EZS27_010042 [termite gut metagenome]|uniref:Uncharacterized protein n=1 Tax=termite gut metagenome TaxID=433724 RepID=A0A5J4S8L4_9ZZZZ
MGKYALFYALLKNLKGYDKETAVQNFTGGRTTHLSELTKEEYRGICDYLQGIVNINADRRKAGSQVLNLLTEMGFKTIRKESWVEIDRFLSDGRIAGKRYRELTTDECEKLVPKLRSMRDKGYLAKDIYKLNQ